MRRLTFLAMVVIGCGLTVVAPAQAPSRGVTVFEGARNVTEEEATELAKQRAARHGHAVEDLEILVVDELPQQVGVLRVDPDHGKLSVDQAGRQPGRRRAR